MFAYFHLCLFCVFFTYPKLSHQDVSNAAQNCHTVKNIPAVFEIVLAFMKGKERKGENPWKYITDRSHWNTAGLTSQQLHSSCPSSLLYAVPPPIEKEKWWHRWYYFHSPTCSLQLNGALDETGRTEAAIKVKHPDKRVRRLSGAPCYLCAFWFMVNICRIIYSNPSPHNLHPPVIVASLFSACLSIIRPLTVLIHLRFFFSFPAFFCSAHDWTCHYFFSFTTSIWTEMYFLSYKVRA